MDRPTCFLVEACSGTTSSWTVEYCCVEYKWWVLFTLMENYIDKSLLLFCFLWKKRPCLKGLSNYCVGYHYHLIRSTAARMCGTYIMETNVSTLVVLWAVSNVICEHCLYADFIVKALLFSNDCSLQIAYTSSSPRGLLHAPAWVAIICCLDEWNL